MISRITRKFRIYVRFLKANFQSQLEYRLDFFLYTLAALISPLLGLAVWLAASNSGAKLLLNREQLISYFGVVLFVGMLSQTWHGWFVAEDINLGNFSKFLIKPFHLTDEYFLTVLTDKIFKFFFTSILFILALVLFHFSLTGLYFDFQTISLFLLSLFLAFWISFNLETIIGISTFWIHEIDFLKDIESIANQVLTGRIIPLIFYPTALANVIYLTPFRYVVSFPVEIIMHRLSTRDLLIGFSLQFFWFVASILFYKFLYRKGVMKFQAYG